MDARRKQSDLSSIQAQFDAKYRQHLSALDDAFASNIQWIESTVDDGLRQIGAERCRNKRKHPEVPKFPENKENTIGAKKPEGALHAASLFTESHLLAMQRPYQGGRPEHEHLHSKTLSSMSATRQ